MSSSSEIPIYSTVTIERVEYPDTENKLEAPPIAGDGLELPIPEEIDPESVLENESKAFLVAVHAAEAGRPDGPSREIGDSPEGPTPIDAVDDGAPSLATAIGGVYLPPGVYAGGVEVPIIPPNSGFEGGPPGLGGGVYPPNPNGDTDVVVQAWGFTSTDEEFPRPEPLALDGEPLRDSATVSDLDRNPDRAPIGDGLFDPEVSVVFPFGTEDASLEPPGVVLSGGESGGFGRLDRGSDNPVLSFNGETDTLSTAPDPVKNAATNIESINDGITAPTPSDEYFILGLHHPEVGSGNPTKRDSLVGIAPLPLGEFTSVRVPVSDTPFTPSKDFPPSQDKDLSVTLWHGPEGEFQGPIKGPIGDPLIESVSANGLFEENGLPEE